MKAWLLVRLARLDRLTRRERLVTGLCACAVAWFLIDSMLVSPAQQQARTLEQLLAPQREEVSKASAELEKLQSGRAPVGDPALLDRLEQIDKATLSIDTSLRASQQYIVPAEMMSKLLQDILRKDKRLELVSMQTLPVAPIVPAGSAPATSPIKAVPTDPLAKDAVPDASMYRHGVQLIVRGNYLDVMTYLQEVEKLPWQMYWGRFVMSADGTDKPTFYVSLYTLSLDKSWLVI